MKMITKTAVAALICSGALAASANADTITFDHLVDSAAITSGLGNEVDLNNDGINDIGVDVDFLGPDAEVADINGIVEQDIGDGIFQDVYVFTETNFLEGTIVSEFVAGDEVGPDTFFNGVGGNGGNLYINNVGGMLSGGTGDTGFFGFSITTYVPGVTVAPVCELLIGDICFDNDDVENVNRSGDNGRSVDEEGSEPAILSVVYGWAEVTRGSVLFGTVGIGANGGVATVPTSSTTPVPLPAGLPLLLAGLGAFGVLRSRKNKAA